LALQVVLDSCGNNYQRSPNLVALAEGFDRNLDAVSRDPDLLDNALELDLRAGFLRPLSDFIVESVPVNGIG